MRRRLDLDRLTAILFITPSIIAILVFVYGFIGWTGWASLLKVGQYCHDRQGQTVPRRAICRHG